MIEVASFLVLAVVGYAVGVEPLRRVARRLERENRLRDRDGTDLRETAP